MYGITSRRFIGNGINPQAGDSWTVQSSGTTLIFISVVWFINKFVAVGQSGIIYTSPNGVTWTQRTSNTTSNLLEVSSSGNLCVAVGGQTNNIVYSTDGITWTLGSTSSADLAGVQFVNGTFYAHIQSGTIPQLYKSTNGSSWSTASTGVTVSAYGTTTSYTDSIAWNGSLYIITGSWSAFVNPYFYNGRFSLYSTNGTTWTAGSTNIVRVQWNGTKFTSYNSSGYFQESSDGYTWTTLGGPTTAYPGSRAVTYAGNRLIRVGDSISQFPYNNAGSVDISDTSGTQWIAKNTGSGSTVRSLAYSGSILVAVGESGLVATSSA